MPSDLHTRVSTKATGELDIGDVLSGGKYADILSVALENSFDGAPTALRTYVSNVALASHAFSGFSQRTLEIILDKAAEVFATMVVASTQSKSKAFERVVAADLPLVRDNLLEKIVNARKPNSPPSGIKMSRSGIRGMIIFAYSTTFMILAFACVAVVDLAGISPKTSEPPAKKPILAKITKPSLWKIISTDVANNILGVKNEVKDVLSEEEEKTDALPVDEKWKKMISDVDRLILDGVAVVDVAGYFLIGNVRDYTSGIKSLSSGRVRKTKAERIYSIARPGNTAGGDFGVYTRFAGLAFRTILEKPKSSEWLSRMASLVFVVLSMGNRKLDKAEPESFFPKQGETASDDNIVSGIKQLEIPAIRYSIIMLTMFQAVKQYESKGIFTFWKSDEAKKTKRVEIEVEG